MFSAGLRRLNTSLRFSFGETVMLQRRQREARIAQKIKETLHTSFISVVDVSVGNNSCGTMYKITVEAESFSGKSRVEQHRMVTQSIEDELKTIHGYTLKTKVPESPANTQQKEGRETETFK